jgi:hypothetical protein
MFLIDVTEGPCKGKQIQVRDGMSVTLGRQSHAQFPIPADNTLSGTHCTLVARGNRLQLIDEGSSNGTYVDGDRIQSSRLLPGQRFQAGRCEFFGTPLPLVWKLVDFPQSHRDGPNCRDAGFKLPRLGRFPTNILFTEEPVPISFPLAEYIRRQLLSAGEALPMPRVHGPIPTKANDATEAYLLRIEFDAAGGVAALLRQLFVCREGIAGTISMTTLGQERQHVERMFDAVVAKARFLPRLDTRRNRS